MNKLNTRIEDEKEPNVALKKLLNLIKLAICKNNKAIKFVLDHAATKMNRPINIHVLLGKIDPEKDLNRTPSNGKLSCSISPTSFPSLISLFKSPDIPIVDEDADIPEETLSKRLGLDKILGNGKIKE